MSKIYSLYFLLSLISLGHAFIQIPMRVKTHFARVLQMGVQADLMNDMKTAMKAKDAGRLVAIKAMRAAIKQKEVDERIEVVTDDMAIEIFSKMLKQRKESIASYQKAGRDDLVAGEQSEVAVIMEYMPVQLSHEEVQTIIDEAIAATCASSIKDMGKVMSIVREKTAGRADPAVLGGKIKAILNNN